MPELKEAKQQHGSLCWRVLNYFKKPKGCPIFSGAANKLKDQLLITGETTGLVKVTLDKLFVNEKSVKARKKEDGSNFFVTPELVRRK